MDSQNSLDYASFQLSPTRTRCEIYAGISNKQEKLASGIIFKPFVFHVQAIKEQYALGSSCILLQRPSGNGNYSNTLTWFTKGTLQRLIMFVKNPDLLERVGAIETEIKQLDDTFKMQTRNSSKDCGTFLRSSNSSFSLGHKRIMAPYVGEAVKQINSNSGDNGDGFTAESRKQLLEALEARYMVLNKEQGSCFTTAEVAGFDNEHLKDLIAFSDAFGALRLKAACIQFMLLQNKKNDCGVWLRQVDVVGCAHGDQLFVGSNSDTISTSSEENESNIDSQDSLCVSEMIDSPGSCCSHPEMLIAESLGNDLSASRNESQGYQNSVDNFSPRIQTLITDHNDGPLYVQATETFCDSPSGMTVIENELFLSDDDCILEKTLESDSDASRTSVRDFVSIFERRCQEQNEIGDHVSNVKIQKINKSILERWTSSVMSDVDLSNNSSKASSDIEDLSSCYNVMDNPIHDSMDDDDEYCSDVNYNESFRNDIWCKQDYSISHFNSCVVDDVVDDVPADDVPVVVNVAQPKSVEVEVVPSVLSPNKITSEVKKCADFSGPSEERVRNFLDRYNEKRELKIRSRYGDKRERNDDCKTVQGIRAVKPKTENQTLNPPRHQARSVRTFNGSVLKDVQKTNKEIPSRNKNTSNIGGKKSSTVAENASSRMQHTKYPKPQILIKSELDNKVSGLVKTQKHVLSNGSMPSTHKDKIGALRKPISTQSEINAKETSANHIRSNISQLKQSNQPALSQKSLNSSANANNSHVNRKRSDLPPAGLSLDKKIKDSPFPNSNGIEPKQLPAKSFLKKGSGAKSKSADLGVMNSKSYIDKKGTGKKVKTEPRTTKDVQIEKKTVRNIKKKPSGSTNKLMSSNPAKVVINNPDNSVRQASETLVQVQLNSEQIESISLGTLNEDARSSVSSSISEVQDDPNSGSKALHEVESFEESQNVTETKQETVSSVARSFDMVPEVVIQVYEPFTQQSAQQDSCIATTGSITDDTTKDKVCDNFLCVLPEVEKIPPPSTPGEPLANGFQRKLETFQTPTIEDPSPNMSTNINCSGVSDVSRNEFKQPRSKWGTPRYISFVEHTPSNQGIDLKRFLKFGRSAREYNEEHDGKILASDITKIAGSPPDMVNCYGRKKHTSAKKTSITGLTFQRSASIREERVKHSGAPTSKVTRAIYSLAMPFRKKSVEAK